ncbi:hypothetical protein [Komagataeibacter intermedius]|nr:hypothetical protein [Komagataeibacter intermedius]
MGEYNVGGNIVTRDGVVFVCVTADGVRAHLRACYRQDDVA